MGNSHSSRRPRFHIGLGTSGAPAPSPMPSPRSEVARATWKTTEEFVPPVDGGKVIKVYDGDTITVATTMPWASYMISERNKIYRFSIRLRGLDTPEIRSSDEEEKLMGRFVQEKLHNMLFGEFVRLENVEVEPKYGRILATVIRESDDLDICDWLLENRMAVPYDGGTKHAPISWKKYYEGSDTRVQFKAR